MEASIYARIERRSLSTDSTFVEKEHCKEMSAAFDAVMLEALMISINY